MKEKLIARILRIRRDMIRELESLETRIHVHNHLTASVASLHTMQHELDRLEAKLSLLEELELQ